MLVRSMSLEKGIAHGMEWRKPYYSRAQRIDRTCRPHGGCPWCVENRMHSLRCRIDAAEYQEEESRLAGIVTAWRDAMLQENDEAKGGIK